MTIPFIPHTTPDARMAPLAEALAREPNTMLTALAEALAGRIGPAKAARILKLAADAAERLE